MTHKCDIRSNDQSNKFIDEGVGLGWNEGVAPLPTNIHVLIWFILIVYFGTHYVRFMSSFARNNKCILM